MSLPTSFLSLTLDSSPAETRLEFWHASSAQLQLPAEIQIRTLGEVLGEKLNVAELQTDSELLKQTLKENWLSLTRSQDCILVGDDLSPVLMEILPSVPKRILDVGKMDILNRDPSRKWLAHCRLRESLHDSVIGAAPRLDTTQVAYVTGLGADMRVGVDVAVQLGFPVIKLVVPKRAEGEFAVTQLRRNYFSIDFQVLEYADLTMQKNNGTLLVNTVNFKIEADLRQDLSYLNFILDEGLICDLNLLPLQNQMIEEARNVGLPTLAGWQILGHQDWLLLRTMFPDWSVLRTDYLRHWQEHLASSPTKV